MVQWMSLVGIKNKQLRKVRSLRQLKIAEALILAKREI